MTGEIYILYYDSKNKLININSMAYSLFLSNLYNFPILFTHKFAFIQNLKILCASYLMVSLSKPNNLCVNRRT